MSAKEVVAAYWAAAEARDWDTFGVLVAQDVLYEWRFYPSGIGCALLGLRTSPGRSPVAEACRHDDGDERTTATVMKTSTSATT